MLPNWHDAVSVHDHQHQSATYAFPSLYKALQMCIATRVNTHAVHKAFLPTQSAINSHTEPSLHTLILLIHWQDVSGMHAS